MKPSAISLLACAATLAFVASTLRAQNANTITGQVFARERANGQQSLLVTLTAASPIRLVRMKLPLRLEAQLGSAPAGWQMTQNGRDLRVSGQPQTRVDLRFDTPANSGLLQNVIRQQTMDDLWATIDGMRESRLRLPVEGLPKVEIRADLDRSGTFPPEVTPGAPILFTPADTYVAGTWRFTHRDGTEDVAHRAKADTLDFSVALGGPMVTDRLWYYVPQAGDRVTYRDQWNEQLLDVTQPWAETATAPQCADNTIVGGTPQVFAGQTACVTGCFSDLQKAAMMLMLDGETPLPPQAASPSTIQVRVPADAKPGWHDVRLGVGPGGRLRLEVLELQGNVDQSKLWTGESTTIRFTVLGTMRTVAIRVENRTPGVIDLEGGTVQVLKTSGGVKNGVTRQIRGVKRGAFNIDYRIDQPWCGVAPPAAGR